MIVLVCFSTAMCMIRLLTPRLLLLYFHGQTKSCGFGGATSSKLHDPNEKTCVDSEKLNASIKVDKKLQRPTMTDPDYTGAGDLSSGVIPESRALEQITGNDLDVSDGGSKSLKVSEVVQDEKDEAVDDKRASQVDSFAAANKLNDVYLNIRMPNGGNLQDKFSLTSTLRMVKEYVDEHQDGIIGSYDLAIPYPRKVYSDQGMSV